MPSKTGLKPAITIEQQIELLESRGLVIDQKDKANLFLMDNNYYRLNVYFHKLMDNQNHFIPETNFSKVIKIYDIDRYLRKQIFSRLRNLFSVNSSQKNPSFFNNRMTCQSNSASRFATPRWFPSTARKPIAGMKPHLEKHPPPWCACGSLC